MTVRSKGHISSLQCYNRATCSALNVITYVCKAVCLGIRPLSGAGARQPVKIHDHRRACDAVNRARRWEHKNIATHAHTHTHSHTHRRATRTWTPREQPAHRQWRCACDHQLWSERSNGLLCVCVCGTTGVSCLLRSSMSPEVQWHRFHLQLTSQLLLYHTHAHLLGCKALEGCRSHRR